MLQYEIYYWPRFASTQGPRQLLKCCGAQTPNDGLPHDRSSRCQPLWWHDIIESPLLVPPSHYQQEDRYTGGHNSARRQRWLAVLRFPSPAFKQRMAVVNGPCLARHMAPTAASAPERVDGGGIHSSPAPQGIRHVTACRTGRGEGDEKGRGSRCFKRGGGGRGAQKHRYRHLVLDCPPLTCRGATVLVQ